MGDDTSFWVSRNLGYVQVDGTVKAVSENAVWIFDNSAEVDERGLSRAIDAFENGIWPEVTRVFGDIWTPGVDGDARLFIYHTGLWRGAAGYFSSVNELPDELHRFSNERESIYISDNVPVGTSSYLSVLSHELQHAVHWAADPDEESWLNEGLAELAKSVVGWGKPRAEAFLLRPDTSLTHWPATGENTGPSYGAAGLFLEYLAEHYGGERLIAELVNDPADGLESVDRALDRLGAGVTSLDVFRDWVAANYLDSPAGRYSYGDRDLRAGLRVAVDFVLEPRSVEGSVGQFAANYYLAKIPAEELVISFQGDPAAELIPVAPHSGNACWWSNDGDGIDATLTRRLDLSDVSSAELKYKVWHSIEEDWDYAYVEASVDGGETWTVLDTALTTMANPNGNSYGPGITGESDGWVDDSVDLTPYAGQEALLRFEYVTDDAVHGRGLCLDDLSVAAIGWYDDAETDGGWAADGFVRVNNLVPEEFLVQVIRESPGGANAGMHRLHVNEDGSGELRLANVQEGEKVVVIVSAVTRESAAKASYTLHFTDEAVES